MVEEMKGRSRECLDRGWLFHKGDVSIPSSVKAGMTGGLTDCWGIQEGEWPDIAYKEHLKDSALDPSQWTSVDLPHDWCVEGDYDRTAEPYHGFLPVGIGCYRKVFELPASDLGKKIYVQFDGVMRNSTVWVNGHLIGTHPSGYTSFFYDLTDVLRYGDEGKNVIFVRVDARDHEGWWYEGCGIYRHVWLLKTDPLHVEHWGTYITTPRITDQSAEVCIRTTVRNEYAGDKPCELVSKVIDAAGHVVAVVSAQAVIIAGEEHEFKQTAIVPQPKLWSPDTPYLYQVFTEVRSEGELLDTYETPFGIRSIEFTADRGFFLNGKPLVIKGTCNHQDFAGLGVALPDRVIEYKIRLLKEMGANAYRSAHHPPTPELLDICDRLGMLVMDENRKLDSSPEGIANLKSMLYRDRNHPCIILWSMENEEVLEGKPMGTRILTTLARITRAIDPTRPVIAAMNQGWNEGGYSDALDVVGYNYGQRRAQDVTDHFRYPQRKIIGSESASCTTTRGIYEVDEEKGYVPAYGTVLPSWGCTPEQAWRDVVENPFLTGLFIWTGFDYRGEPTPYKWPCINSHFGVMDTCGFPKDWYYYLKAAWTDEPLVHIFPHWTWPGKEGQEIEIWAFSNCEAVELFLNGRSLGEKRMIPNGHLVWKVKYVPGELVARAYRNGQQVATKVVATTNPPARISLEPDRIEILADGRDVSIIRVSIKDDQDRVVPIADNEVRFTLEGPGKLIGVGNGDPSSHEPDKGTRRRAFNGYCLAIVQAGEEPGKITLRATSPGLLPAMTVIQTQR